MAFSKLRQSNTPRVVRGVYLVLFWIPTYSKLSIKDIRHVRFINIWKRDRLAISVNTISPWQFATATTAYNLCSNVFLVFQTETSIKLKFAKLFDVNVNSTFWNYNRIVDMLQRNVHISKVAQKMIW